jgi:hypothetical protein
LSSANFATISIPVIAESSDQIARSEGFDAVTARKVQTGAAPLKAG